jgi:hypothetical protein
MDYGRQTFSDVLSFPDVPAAAAADRPSGRRWWPLGLLLLALGVHGPAAALRSSPGYLDAAYYVHLAHNLLAGRGFVSTVIWHWLTVPATITHPEGDYWPPLWPLLSALGAALTGLDPFRAAQALTLLGMVGMTLLAGGLAARVFPTARWAPWLAGLSTTMGTGYWTHLHGADTFGLYGLLGATTLLATARATTRRAFFSLGLLGGLGALLRADGLLLLAPAVWRARRQTATLLLLALGAGLVLLPWWLYALLVLGHPPGSLGLRTLWLRRYEDMFLPGADLSLAAHLAWGGENILRARFRALVENSTAPVLLGGVALWPVGLLGLLRLRRHPLLAPAWAYGVVLYGGLSLLFPFPSQRGTLLHSLVAVLPFWAVAVVGGVQAIARWRPLRRSWAGVALPALLVLLAVGVSLGLGRRTEARWDRKAQAYRAVGTALAAMGRAGEPVMAVDPALYTVLTGTPAVVVADLPPEAVRPLAHRLGVRLLLLEEDSAAAWQPLVAGAVPGFRLLWAGLPAPDREPVWVFALEED